jgi:signal transduction histidine kinase
MALTPALAGCAEGPLETGAWIYVTLATAAAGVAGYLLGAWRARAAAAGRLRQCHGTLRLHTQLLAEGTWETDASHHLLDWRGPDQSPGAAPAELFDGALATQELAVRLRSMQAFSGLRVPVRSAPGGGGWELRGVPRQDDLGAFSGFVGTARRSDGDDALRVAAAALAPALDGHAEPALLLCRHDGVWRLRQANAAAAARWTGLSAGDDFGPALADLPPGIGAACAELAEGGTAEVEGWRLSALSGVPVDLHGLLLVRLPAPLPAAPEASDGDTLSFTVTHDLRAPIRVVEGFTRIVKEDYGRLLDRVGNDHLDRVLGAAARMNLMIDALLTLARLSTQPLMRQPVNLSQLAGWVADDLRRSAPARLAEIDIEPGLTVQGDPTLLRQVLENLLGNAWKYSARREHASISLRRATDAGRTVYAVRDNGAGFDMRHAERLFGLFQRLHSASDFPGHGVGLASVRRIVRRHGGDVWAEAEPGRGAAFFFTLG